MGGRWGFDAKERAGRGPRRRRRRRGGAEGRAGGEGGGVDTRGARGVVEAGPGPGQACCPGPPGAEGRGSAQGAWRHRRRRRRDRARRSAGRWRRYLGGAGGGSRRRGLGQRRAGDGGWARSSSGDEGAAAGARGEKGGIPERGGWGWGLRHPSRSRWDSRVGEWGTFVDTRCVPARVGAR